MSDAPIEPQDYIYGVKVVQIEDLRVAEDVVGGMAKTSKALVVAARKRNQTKQSPS